MLLVLAGLKIVGACSMSRATGIILLLLASMMAAVFGCAASEPEVRASLTHEQIESALGCTPLCLVIAGENIEGAGSGVLVHPRIVATVAHIVPPEPRSLIAFVSEESAGEAMGIARVVRGTESGFWDGDWALLVLDRPFSSLPAGVAPGLPAGGGGPRVGDEVVIGGFPLAGDGSDVLHRRSVLVRTALIDPPEGVGDSPHVMYAANRGRRSRVGLSGSPAVMVREGEGPVLIGLYSGSTRIELLGLVASAPLVIQRLPIEAIARVAAELEVGAGVGSRSAEGLADVSEARGHLDEAREAEGADEQADDEGGDAGGVGGGAVEELEECRAAGEEGESGADVGEEGALVGERGAVDGEAVAEERGVGGDGGGGVGGHGRQGRERVTSMNGRAVPFGPGTGRAVRGPSTIVVACFGRDRVCAGGWMVADACADGSVEAGHSCQRLVPQVRPPPKPTNMTFMPGATRPASRSSWRQRGTEAATVLA